MPVGTNTPTEAPAARALRRISAIAATACAAIGALSLPAYASGFHPLRALGWNLAVQPNACVGLVAAGLAVLLASRAGSVARVIATPLAVLAAALGGATLVEHALGMDLGIDLAVMSAGGVAADPATVAPGRMGPPAALNLAAAGLAALLLQIRSRSAHQAAQVLAVCVAPVPLLGTVGYLYGVSAFYRLAPLTAIGFPAALALLLLDAAILFARPESGLAAHLAGDGAGSALARRMLAYAVAVPIGLGGFALAGRSAGLYEGVFAVSALVVALVVAFAALVLRDAAALDRMERAKQRAQVERERSRDELARALHREREAREAAETANHAKDRFLAALSHELRTPLNAIMGWSRLLRGGEAEPERAARGLDAIERNSRALADVVSDLLDMSGLASGNVRIAHVPVDLARPVAAAVEAVRPAAEAKGIQVEGAAALGPQHVLGDPARLRQIAWNLLSNAVKFTPPGGRVEVRLSGAGGRVVLEIADSGAGLAEEFLPHLFDPFTQADASPSRQHGGLGLGLSITRQLVVMHGGRIEAESAGPDRGATFRVILPADPAGAEARAAGADRARLEGARVLVVDDEVDSRELLMQLLASWGARPSGAISAAEALLAMLREPPDLLVSDIAMPGEDGYALVRALRAAEAARGLPRTPAVALTAFTRPEDRTRVLAAGFDAHMAKPVEPDELLATLCGLVPPRERPLAAQGEARGPAPRRAQGADGALAAG